MATRRVPHRAISRPGDPAIVPHQRAVTTVLGGAISAALSSLVSDDYDATADGVDAANLTLTALRAGSVPAAGVVTWSVRYSTVSASLSSVAASAGTIANDGVDSSTITAPMLDATGAPLVGVPLSAITCASTGSNNTITAVDSVTDYLGRGRWTLKSTTAEAKTVSIAYAGTTVTQTIGVTVTGGAIAYPNEPSGYTRFVETDYSAQPANPLPVDGGGATLESPTTNITLETSPTRMRYHHIAGTQPGYSPPSYALFSMWDTSDQLSSTEYSEIYVYDEVTLVGNGGTYETPPVGFKFAGYFGVANNNQNPASGPGAVQWYTLARPVSLDSSTPAQASEFYFDIRTQMTGSTPGNQDYAQNENTGTHLIVGTKHVVEIVAKLNSASGVADGILQAWIDDVRVINYSNVPWTNTAYAQYGSTGMSGFFGRYADLVWGGSGGANKTRDDSTDWHKTYISGVFLRAADPF